jgi:hypothetical protein
MSGKKEKVRRKAAGIDLKVKRADVVAQREQKAQAALEAYKSLMPKGRNAGALILASVLGATE